MAEPRHGISAFGELKYPAGFKHFDYVNPDAPKGGRISMIGTAGRITFDSFNDFLVKGDAAQGLTYLYDTLMTRAWDEPDAAYGLVAETADISDDGLSVTFTLRPEAKFADGKQITADDIVFSFETLKAKGHPRFSLPLRDVEKAEALAPQTVRFTFKGDQTRDLPLIVALLPILPKHFYATRDFTKTTLKPPLASGPYRIGKFEQGKYVTYERREDYWAADLNVNRGRFNFDELRYEYFLDRNAELEALKAHNYDLREEFTSRDWATAYDISQVNSGRMIKEELPDSSPSGTQGFFLNVRRKKFQDIRVRQALDYAFDFEWTRKTLFFGAYERTESYFENSDMKAVGEPTPAELALLEP
ncbi:MAG: extracellular solute-binding protein, partial [Hyphomicrobiaceae bacterium]